MRLYNNREYKWWIVNNAHYCHFCKDKNIYNSIGMLVVNKYGLHQYNNGYWNKISIEFYRHVKECHPDVTIKNS